MKRGAKRFANLPYLLVMVFAGLSIWLSLELKKSRLQNNQRGKYTIENHGNGIGELKLQISVLRQLLEFNFSAKPELLPQNLKYLASSKGKKTVMYLKREGCNACNIGVVGWALRTLLPNENFFVFAHTENEFFLQSTSGNDNIASHERVILTTNQLYPHPPRGNAHDAELLLLDHQNRITGIIPLEYRKLKGCLMGWLMG